MAWVTEYDMTWRASENHYGKIYLQRDGGSYQRSLLLVSNSLEMRKMLNSWEEHVARMNCSFTILNNLTDFYELMPLMTISNGQIKVIVTNDSYASAPIKMFEGFLNVEAISQDMLSFSELTLGASGLLNKLQYDHPTSIDTLQYMTLIDIIDDCLLMTGANYPIYVNCELYELNAALGAGQTLFNRIGISTEAFWENNIERKSALEILELILRTFNCYLHWHNERWYIDHYENLNQNKTYVVYQSGTSAGYGYSDSGTTDPVLILTAQIHGSVFHKQMGGTQILSVIPGLKQLDIKLDQKPFFNLLNPDLSICEDTTTAEPLLERREWLSYDLNSPPVVDWLTRGKSWKNIDNSIRRYRFDTTNGSLQLNGLTTRFTTSTNGFDTELIITFKFGVHSVGQIAPWYDDSQFENNPEDTTITFYWYLCTYESVIANRDFFWHNPATGMWEYVIDGDEQTNYNTLQITVADLDEDLLTYTGTLKIPIGDLVSSSSGDSDDLDLVFRMGTELVERFGYASNPTYLCFYGDFKAAVSGDQEDNLFRGSINTDFLDKLTVNLELFDAGWNYRNALVRPTGVVYLTDLWGYGSDGELLAKVLLASKFRLYRIARQRIEMDVYDASSPAYGLMGPWIDSKQSNKVFIMLGYVFKPQLNIKHVILYEYDDSEVINLV